MHRLGALDADGDKMVSWDEFKRAADVIERYEEEEEEPWSPVSPVYVSPRVLRSPAYDSGGALRPAAALRHRLAARRPVSEFSTRSLASTRS